jgi:hypothetical protein
MDSKSVNPTQHSEFSREDTLHIPESPAPRGYLSNPFRSILEEAHQLLNEYLSPESQWGAEEGEAGMTIRQRDSTLSRIPVTKGTCFIPNFRPIEVLACIHSIGYRTIWDTRVASGRVIQRYGQFTFLFYIVFRGIGQIYVPRDGAGIQDVRCWGPHGVPQNTAYPNTEQVDMVFRSVETPEVPLQKDKVRMQINLGAYRIVWVPEMQGCNVTFVGDADVGSVLPTYIYNALSRELPKVVYRLRGAMEHFGVAPYLLDAQDCVVVQTTFYFVQSRMIKFRHHVRKPGSYSIVLDRIRMYPQGESPFLLLILPLV